ncbi:MAG: tRNA pseudouridine(55) synthase TruB [Trichodesmium sp. St7_bin2_1]|nr:tRNA pseudouridine(55) synthase TruB [Trichodesmium sp. St7_bin2_1]
MEGFLNLNKPSGMTSHDCVAKVRKLLRLKRVGHGGTLDPAATGVLPIAVGKATRLLQFLPSAKVYHGTVRFGVITTTDDLEGEIVQSAPASELISSHIEAVLPNFLGKIEQVPPTYSAIQVQGKRLYNLARQGKTVDVPARIVEVFNIEILDWRGGDFPEVDLAIACGTGTYIRAIARDLGTILNTGGTLAALTRKESSGFFEENSLTFPEVENQLQENKFSLLSMEIALAHLPAIALVAEDAKRWCQGQRLPYQIRWEIEPEKTEHHFRVHNHEDKLLGIGQLIKSEENLLLAPQVVISSYSSFGLDEV